MKSTIFVFILKNVDIKIKIYYWDNQSFVKLCCDLWFEVYIYVFIIYSNKRIMIQLRFSKRFIYSVENFKIKLIIMKILVVIKIIWSYNTK